MTDKFNRFYIKLLKSIQNAIPSPLIELEINTMTQLDIKTDAYLKIFEAHDVKYADAVFENDPKAFAPGATWAHLKFHEIWARMTPIEHQHAFKEFQMLHRAASLIRVCGDHYESIAKISEKFAKKGGNVGANVMHDMMNGGELARFTMNMMKDPKAMQNLMKDIGNITRGFESKEFAQVCQMSQKLMQTNSDEVPSISLGTETEAKTGSPETGSPETGSPETKTETETETVGESLKTLQINEPQ